MDLTKINIAICAQAGQGVEKALELLVQIAKKHNYYCSSAKDYKSRIRGGVNCSTLLISKEEQNGYYRDIDFLVALTDGAVEHLNLNERIQKNTFIIYNKGVNIKGAENSASLEVDFNTPALESGSKIAVNAVAIGIISALMNFDNSITQQVIKENFPDENTATMNLNAIKKGIEKWQEVKQFVINIEQMPHVQEKILISGNDALALGCISGGCDFISYYPMTPGSELYQFLSNTDPKFKIAFEQCEDEISVINMALGVWYAGGRAMITTSGGGFDLMCEAISLAGMIESPIVAHIGQRPGPATGLPTRTEQGDLQLALYAGHGEFARIIFAPSTPQNALEIGCNAFNLADKLQVPVFILTDQYFIDSHFTTDILDLDKAECERHITETTPEYKRYEITENCISPRGIPSHGSGLVRVDSDEHNEFGEIEENPTNRKNMVNKRLKKSDEIQKHILEPEFFGDENYHTLIISWGSTFYTVKEVVKLLPGSAMLHYTQLYPISDKINDYLEDNKTTIIVENNATAQFSKIIKLKTGKDITHKILQYDGFPFSVESLLTSIKEGINGQL